MLWIPGVSYTRSGLISSLEFRQICHFRKTKFRSPGIISHFHQGRETTINARMAWRAMRLNHPPPQAIVWKILFAICWWCTRNNYKNSIDHNTHRKRKENMISFVVHYGILSKKIHINSKPRNHFKIYLEFTHWQSSPKMAFDLDQHLSEKYITNVLKNTC